MGPLGRAALLPSGDFPPAHEHELGAVLRDLASSFEQIENTLRRLMAERM